MPYSIYHFFKRLVKDKSLFQKVENLEDFPFDKTMLACKNAGQFPDLAIRLNIDDSLFTGGELIELKDSKSYTVASFNSTIPSGRKDIDQVIKSVNSSIRKQMEDAGNHIYSLPFRDVYYLIRGRRNGDTKIVLVHGAFFETVKSDALISQSFEQVLDERLTKYNITLDETAKSVLIDMFSEQESFSKVRNVDNASVKLRFRIMTEVKLEGNILNSKQYPEIKNNTINLVVPYKTEFEKTAAIHWFQNVFDTDEMKPFSIVSIKHRLDGYFLVFQTKL
ncbi:MAG: hypothetical protein LBE74_09385 [Treponema sp.]|jgi:hypothetical protein|nr:hypothetical protein [Treponema sp.]